MLTSLETLFSKPDNRIEQDIPWKVSEFETSKGTFPVAKASELHLELLHTDKRRLKVDGSIDITFNIPCDRCLEDVPVSFPIRFHKEIDCNHLDTEDNSDDTQYIVDNALDTDKIIRDELLLEWPAKILCREDCKGICRVCGHNLNVSDCGCDRVVLDPRMAAIQDIFKNANK